MEKLSCLKNYKEQYYEVSLSIIKSSDNSYLTNNMFFYCNQSLRVSGFQKDQPSMIIVLYSLYVNISDWSSSLTVWEHMEAQSRLSHRPLPKFLFHGWEQVPISKAHLDFNFNFSVNNLLLFKNTRSTYPLTFFVQLNEIIY